MEKVRDSFIMNAYTKVPGRILLGHPEQGNRDSPRVFNESRYFSSSPAGGNDDDQRIVGGTVAEQAEFPWAVALSLG